MDTQTMKRGWRWSIYGLLASGIAYSYFGDPRMALYSISIRRDF